MFYEDFPYASDEEFYQARIASLPNWTSFVNTFSEQYLSSKLEAFGCYRSQIPMLFGTAMKMVTEFTDYTRKVSGLDHLFGERYWKMLVKVQGSVKRPTSLTTPQTWTRASRETTRWARSVCLIPRASPGRTAHSS